MRGERGHPSLVGYAGARVKLRSLFIVPFAVQFAALDVAMRTRSAWDGRAVVGLVESVVLWATLALLATTRTRRVVLAFAAAALLVVQLFVHRYYRVPLDVQV